MCGVALFILDMSVCEWFMDQTYMHCVLPVNNIQKLCQFTEHFVTSIKITLNLVLSEGWGKTISSFFFFSFIWWMSLRSFLIGSLYLVSILGSFSIHVFLPKIGIFWRQQNIMFWLAKWVCMTFGLWWWHFLLHVSLMNPSGTLKFLLNIFWYLEIALVEGHSLTTIFYYV